LQGKNIPQSYLYIGLTSKLNAKNMFLSFQPYFTLFSRNCQLKYSKTQYKYCENFRIYCTTAVKMLKRKKRRLFMSVILTENLKNRGDFAKSFKKEGSKRLTQCVFYDKIAL